MKWPTVTGKGKSVMRLTDEIILAHQLKVVKSVISVPRYLIYKCTNTFFGQVNEI